MIKRCSVVFFGTRVALSEGSDLAQAMEYAKKHTQSLHVPISDNMFEMHASDVLGAKEGEQSHIRKYLYHEETCKPNYTITEKFRIGVPEMKLHFL